MAKRSIFIDNLKVNLKGLDASTAGKVGKLLPEAINRQLQLAHSTSLLTEKPIRVEAFCNAAEVAERIASQVAGNIHRQTRGIDK